MSEKSYSYRLAPCPSYDIDGMQGWLAQMAQKGLHLSSDGFFAGFAIFEKGTSKTVKYRLSPARKTTSFWTNNNGDPEDEEIELSETYGWEYVAKRGEFHIYRSEDPDSRELSTDPEVYAIALKAAFKRRLDAAISSFLWTIIYPLMVIKGNLLLTMLNIGSWLFLFGSALLLWSLINSIIHAVRLGVLRKKLLTERTIDGLTLPTQSPLKYNLLRISYLLLIIVWIFLILNTFGIAITEENEIPLEDFYEDPPFATMADFSPEGSYQQDYFMDISNSVRVWSDPLAPVNYDWDELATVTNANGKISGSLYLDYHETASPFLSKLLAREYRLFDLVKNDYKEPDELPLPELGIDYSYGYYDSIHIPTVVLRHGKKVIHASFHQYHDSEMPIEAWVTILADSIK